MPDRWSTAQVGKKRRLTYVAEGLPSRGNELASETQKAKSVREL
jgi:hypothetical protein